MKTYFILLFALLLSFNIQGQTPNVINYQASVKDDNGKPLANESVSVSITITTNGGNFSDTQTATTNEFGVVNLQLGGPGLKAIDWSKGGANYSISISSSKGNIDLGSINMATVPYALYADKSGSSIVLKRLGIHAGVLKIDNSIPGISFHSSARDHKHL